MSDKMNKPTRLRSILVRHVKEINPNADHSKIDALEEDIVTFVRSIVHGVDDLGLDIKPNNYVGDMD